MVTLQTATIPRPSQGMCKTSTNKLLICELGGHRIRSVDLTTNIITT